MDVADKCLWSTIRYAPEVVDTQGWSTLVSCHAHLVAEAFKALALAETTQLRKRRRLSSGGSSNSTLQSSLIQQLLQNVMVACGTCKSSKKAISYASHCYGTTDRKCNLLVKSCMHQMLNANKNCMQIPTGGTAPPDPKVPPAQLVLADPRALKVTLASVDHQDKEERKEHQAAQEHQDQKAPPDPKVPPAPLVLTDPRALKVTLASVDHQDKEERKEHQAAQEHQDQKVL
eukprot:Em0024g473a